MTHDHNVAALQRGDKFKDARESRPGCYPIRKPAPRIRARWMRNDPLPSGISDPTGFGEGCVI
jgi:hypothetical protein